MLPAGCLWTHHFASIDWFEPWGWARKGSNSAQICKEISLDLYTLHLWCPLPPASLLNLLSTSKYGNLDAYLCLLICISYGAGNEAAQDACTLPTSGWGKEHRVNVMAMQIVNYCIEKMYCSNKFSTPELPSFAFMVSDVSRDKASSKISTKLWAWCLPFLSRTSTLNTGSKQYLWLHHMLQTQRHNLWPL